MYFKIQSFNIYYSEVVFNGFNSSFSYRRLSANYFKILPKNEATFLPKSPGGGYLVYLSDGDVPFFRVSFSPIFSRTGYQKKANFLEQVVKTCQKRKFCYSRLLFSQIFVFLSIFYRFFLEQGII